MEEKLDRREFLYKTLVGGVAALTAVAAAANTGVKPALAKAADSIAPIEAIADFPHKVDEKYERFPVSKNYYHSVFNPENNKRPFNEQFAKADVSDEAGRTDTGKDLPLISGEEILKKNSPVTLCENGCIFFSHHIGVEQPLRRDEPGWTLLEEALNRAGWAVEDNYSGFTAPGSGPGGIIAHYPVDPVTNEAGDEPVPVAGIYNWDSGTADEIREKGELWEFESAEQASLIVKKAARFLGADLAGIAPYDDRWTFADWARPNSVPYKMPNGKVKMVPFNLEKFLKDREAETYGLSIFEADWEKYAGFTPKSVIAIAIEMDYEGFKTAPSLLQSAAAGKVYSNMGEVAYKVATFLRWLGYHAVPSGNDTGLSEPIAVQAGLGEIGRNGLLITQEYGPRVRLCKVFTDLELAPDKPRKFGVVEFCRLCMKCADACPSQAIDFAKDMHMVQPEECNDSMNPYTEKWTVDPYRCNAFAAYNGGDCGNCIAVCSWNKIESWNHDVVRIATKIPLIQDVARKFDEWFGYGGPVVPEERIESGYVTRMVQEFWADTEPTPAR
ncbi:MAG: reductive dehalogenase [Coriobacteriales bacterium]|jgi:reductive dehalogenase|nr:reductive dehalogenase [Coriobacteriales bacterium]